MKKLVVVFAVVSLIVSCTPQEIDKDYRSDDIEKEEIKDGDI